MKRYESGAPLWSLLFAALALPLLLAAVISGLPVGGAAHHPSSGTVRHHDRADDPMEWNGTGSSVGPATS
ncbi:hypothetical protein [Streptomyces sp. NPDC048663]|uniref:hypothetical protein n=1 Tax=Streptomyces sp. NPDC048663 TaxID=3155638 RepID=UPI00343C2D8A